MDMQRARKAMVDSQVRPNDVPDLALQNAMETLPREAFLPGNRRTQAYVEKDVEMFEGRWLLKARDFSKLVHTLRLKPTDLVLDVGCGFGYSTAVLAHLASMAIGLEADAATVEKATAQLGDLDIDNAAVVDGELIAGVPGQGPYDAILIAGGVEEVPTALLEQLSPEGGRLAAIVMRDGLGHATVFTRTGDTFGERVVFEATPAGVLPGFEKAQAFEF